MSVGSVERERIHPLEWLDAHGIRCSWIVFDPAVERHIRRREQSAHDGTALLTTELLWNTLRRLVLRQTYYLPEPPSDGELAHVRYRVGWLRLMSVYGPVEVPAGRINGVRQRTSLPMRIEYRMDCPSDPITVDPDKCWFLRVNTVLPASEEAARLDYLP